MFALLGFFVAASAIFLPSSASSNIVDLGYAQYTGNLSYADTVAYLGLPYAEPPLGDLRFRAPRPLNTSRIAEEANGQPIDATQYPNFCIQGTIGAGDAGGAGSEDCLKVNVYAPVAAKNGSNLPVLYYIHGGGYVYGNPRNWPFDHWIHQSPNVVIVSVYYRLDSFGFLATPEFLNDTQLGDVNAGFQDQIQGLKWVKQYISAFGGDPTKVTINGQSASAAAVVLHLTANEGEQLFTGAIAQSVFRTPVATPTEQQGLFKYYVQHAGCALGNISVTMACLRSASVSALARAQDSASLYYTGLYNQGFHPVLDGKLITDYPTRLILEGQFAKVPLIVGATSDETLVNGPNITAALQSYWPAFTTTDVSELVALYPLSDFQSSAQQQLTVTGDASVRCARTIMADAFSGVTSAWAYRYNQSNPTAISTMVNHAAENWMMFLGTNTGVNGTTMFTGLNPVETAFSEELIAYWLSFVRSGNPNTYKLARSPTWSSYSVNNTMRAVLSEDTHNMTTESGIWIESTSDVETQRCRFVASKEADEQC